MLLSREPQLNAEGVTTLEVVEPFYHRKQQNTMARRKFRAMYRQFFGTIVDLAGVMVTR